MNTASTFIFGAP